MSADRRDDGKPRDYWPVLGVLLAFGPAVVAIASVAYVLLSQ